MPSGNNPVSFISREDNSQATVCMGLQFYTIVNIVKLKYLLCYGSKDTHLVIVKRLPVSFCTRSYSATNTGFMSACFLISVHCFSF